MIDEEQLNELSNEYGVPVQTIQKYYETLLSYPFVLSEDDSYLYNCLEVLVSGKSMDSGSDSNYLETIEKAIYRIYSDTAIPYLSDKFKEKNEIEDE